MQEANEKREYTCGRMLRHYGNRIRVLEEKVKTIRKNQIRLYNTAYVRERRRKKP